MTIKELLKVLSQAPNMDNEVFIPAHIEGINQGMTTQIHWNFDFNGNLELSEGENRE